MELTKGQRNDIFNIITSYSLNLSEFRIEYRQFDESKPYTSIVHLPTKSFFDIKPSTSIYSPYVIKLSPGEDQRIEKVFLKAWNNVLDLLNAWASLLKREIEKNNR